MATSWQTTGIALPAVTAASLGTSENKSHTYIVKAQIMIINGILILNDKSRRLHPSTVS
jgi:uridine kinase